MNPRLTRLRTEFDKVRAGIDEIEARAAAEDRDLTDAEQTDSDTLYARAEQLRVEIEPVAEKHRALEATAEILARISTSRGDTHVHAGGRTADDDAHMRAFDHFLRTGRPNADLEGFRAQGVGTDSAGGFLVPDQMRDRITERLKAYGGVASVVETITTSNGDPLRWPTLDDTANSGVIATEGTAPGAGGADLVFGEKVLGAFRYVAPGTGQLPLRVSVELLQDSAFDVQSLVERKLAERIARKQAVDWVTGAGTTLPFGLTTGTAGTAFTSAGITYAELVAAIHEVDPAYRANAVWTFNDATLAKIEAILDTTGRPIVAPNVQGVEDLPTARGRLLGYPIVIDQAWPTYTDGGTTRWGAFGDLRSGYVIRRVQDVTLIVNPYSRANEGQVEYTMWARADGTVQDANAYRVLINAV